MSSSPYKTCEMCGESRPVTEMRAIHESFVTGQTSGHMHVGGSSGSGSSASMGSGRGPRVSSSRRNSMGYTTGTTRSRIANRFYCIATGCYDRRIEQIRLATARARTFRFLILLILLLGGAYIAYKNGALARLSGQATVPQADQPPPEPPAHHHHADPFISDAAPAAELEQQTPASHNDDGQQAPASHDNDGQQTGSNSASDHVRPANNQSLADAVDSALTSGEVVRWHDDDQGLSGEVSVSAAQSYPGRDCRSYRYTVRQTGDVFTSPGAVGCSVGGQDWSYRNGPP